ncbi:aminotransferase class V-fold PLP-dependent enzyme [Emticicia sp. CRIBPO]|uniref:aminotransferase class V-fold PLP-dependent enzyme n=1 Tax=Emticicia sp. CRIBPO TaxID=2683258 RepID=UPI001E2D516E|nr:aminotransferase class V-fold PLP-dependent enzyme [Emticicia sp. CRIBPO]
MKSLSFYPGPSKVYPEIEAFMNEAFEDGILEQNHRSEAFMALLKDTLDTLKKRLDIPEDYHVFFTSSATECWEISTQSLIRGKAQFLYSGAFGKKWFKYAVTNPQINPTEKYPKPVLRGSRFFEDQEAATVEIDPENDLLCLVDNETSNGTQINTENLEKLRRLNPSAVLMVDATSSFGGVAHDFALADVWFASVQKCLGMPSGMSIMLVSPKAIALAREVNERNHYNSLLNILENFDQYQTHYTPNILSIFLLKRLNHILPSIGEIDKKTKARAADFYAFIKNETTFDLVVSNENTRSDTVFAIKSDPEQLKVLKGKAKEQGIILGNGYGEWKENSFRIANFPAITDEDFDRLKNVLRS